MSNIPLKQAVLLAGAGMVGGIVGCIGDQEKFSDVPMENSSPVCESAFPTDRFDNMLLPLEKEGTYAYHQRLLKYNKEHPSDGLLALSEDTLIKYLDKRHNEAVLREEWYDSSQDVAFVMAVKKLVDMKNIQKELVLAEEKRMDQELNDWAFSKPVVCNYFMPNHPEQSAENYRSLFNEAKLKNPQLHSIENIADDQIEKMAHHLAMNVCSTNPYVAERCKLTIIQLHHNMRNKTSARKIFMPYRVTKSEER